MHDLLKNSKLNILMISLSAKGGGPIQIKLLTDHLKDDFNFHFVIPKECKFNSIKNNKIFFFIKERKIRFVDFYNLFFYVRKNKIDIIHSHGKGASLLGRFMSFFTKLPHVYTYHGIHIETLNSLNKFIYLKYEKLTKFIDYVKIFVSESEKSFAFDNKFISNKSYFQIISNGTINFEINPYLKKRIREKIRNKYKIRKNDALIVNVSRLVDQKNLFELIEICNLLKKTKFIVLGEGDLFEKLSNEIERRNINNLLFLGKVSNVTDFLVASDIYLSTSFYEGHPLSILEAMSVGLPVVASNVVGNKDTIIHNQTGYLYELGNCKQASSFISELLKSENLRSKIGLNAKSQQRRCFNIKKMSSKYKNLYNELTKK